jgi:hypothetical protein
MNTLTEKRQLIKPIVLGVEMMAAQEPLHTPLVVSSNGDGVIADSHPQS